MEGVFLGGYAPNSPIAELWKHYYACLPAILMFYSELFNCVLFGLFKDEVDSRLFEKRLERMADIMSKVYR